MKIHEVLSHIGPRDVSYIHEDSQIQNVIHMMAKQVHTRHTRLVYVVDAEKRLQGTITVGSLLRHIFLHQYEGMIHAQGGLLSFITTETAPHIMERKCVVASQNDSVEEVLKRMASSGVKEMAVLDEGGRIIADITAIDLLRYSFLEK
jgi:CBS domain-containing protein